MPSCPPGSSERPAAIGHGHDRARVSTGGETGRMSTSFLPALVGSMSESAAGNPTGVVMEAAFRHHGLDWRYINLEVAAVDLGAAVAGARAMGFRGFNCSMPHKQTVIAHLDGLTRSAELVGAVNCVIRRPDDRLIGTNTDGVGFLLSLRDVVDPVGQHVVVLGAGGAARAVAVELALAGAARIDIVNRRRSRGDVLAATIAGATATRATSVALHEGYEIPAGTGVVVNATSVGLYTPRNDCRSPPARSPRRWSSPTWCSTPSTRCSCAPLRTAGRASSTVWGCSSTRPPRRSASGRASTPTAP